MTVTDHSIWWIGCPLDLERVIGSGRYLLIKGK